MLIFLLLCVTGVWGSACRRENRELKDEVIQLKMEIVKMKEDIVDLKTDNLQLKIRNQRLREMLGINTTLTAVDECIVNTPDDTSDASTDTNTEEEDSVIMVVGGEDDTRNTVTNVTIWHPTNTTNCTLPSLPQGLQGHSLDYLTLCGGLSKTNGSIGNISSSCLQLQGDNWTEIVTLSTPRAYHVTWPRRGGLQLLGGYAGNMVDERGWSTQRRLRSTQNVVSRRVTSGFLLNRKIASACAVVMDNKIVVTGGRDAANSVTAYDEEGNVEELAHMGEGRQDHGCGVVNLGSEKVIIVAGGQGNKCSHDNCGGRGRGTRYIGAIRSAELYRSRTGTWSEIDRLPSPRSGLRGAVFGGNLYMIGGCSTCSEYNSYTGKCDPSTCGSVLRYNAEAEMWEEQRDLGINAGYHAVSVVPYKDIRDYCIV